MSRSAYIYKLTNTATGKVYCGKTIQTIAQRWWRHCNNALQRNEDTYLYKAIRKYGHDAFSVEELSCVPDDMANHVERVWIQLLCSNNPEFGYNLTAGGDGGATNTGKTLTAEHKRKVGDANKGKVRSVELRQRWSDTKIGMYDGEKNPFFGKTHKAESKSKMGRAKGYVMSAEERETHRIGYLANPHNEESREKMRQASLRYWADVKAGTRVRGGRKTVTTVA